MECFHFCMWLSTCKERLVFVGNLLLFTYYAYNCLFPLFLHTFSLVVYCFTYIYTCTCFVAYSFPSVCEWSTDNSCSSVSICCIVWIQLFNCMFQFSCFIIIDIISIIIFIMCDNVLFTEARWGQNKERNSFYCN